MLILIIIYNIIFPRAGADSVSVAVLSREQCASSLYNILRGIILFFTEIRATLENDKTRVPAAHSVQLKKKKLSTRAVRNEITLRII